MLKSVFAAAIAAAAVPGLAQDARATFNGPFIGAQAGWQQDRRNVELNTGGVNIDATAKKSGFAYGAQVGYDVRLGESVVVGAEVDITGTSGSSRFTDFDLKTGRSIAATARLGFLTDPQGLVYARGGYRNARFSVDSFNGADASFTRDGYTIGAGYERYLASNVSARVEYAYSGLGEDQIFVGNAAQAIDNNRHNVMAGINFRF